MFCENKIETVGKFLLGLPRSILSFCFGFTLDCHKFIRGNALQRLSSALVSLNSVGCHYICVVAALCLLFFLLFVLFTNCSSPMLQLNLHIITIIIIMKSFPINSLICCWSQTEQTAIIRAQGMDQPRKFHHFDSDLTVWRSSLAAYPNPVQWYPLVNEHHYGPRSTMLSAG